MPHTTRPYVLHEATYRQMLDAKPNVAVLPWGATEAHNYHLPYGTDVIEAVAMGEGAVAKANAQGARCVVLPAIPFGIDHTQLDQVATITMRASTQQAVLRDVAQSLVRQGIDRLVLLNFHGGNEFKSMIRDVMFDLPIFIVQVHGYQLDGGVYKLYDNPGGDHANEFETSLILHLAPQWVAMEAAGDGATTPSKLPALSNTPGVWCCRDWRTYTQSTGSGDPRKATAEKGRKTLEILVDAFVPVLVQLSKAQRGEFPFVIREKGNAADAAR
ncbi:MAG: creatininase family protein [Phycisphaeraceae bacterium]